MGTVASLSRTWIKRQIIIGSVVAAIALWFFYDGVVTYPRSNERYHAYQQLVQQGREEAWPAYAQEHQWATKPPEKEYRVRDQYVLGSIALLGSLSAFGLLAFSWKRRISSDETTITTTNGTRVPLSAITRTDRKQWDSKGIAYAVYELDGKKGQIKIDDYKYERAEIILLQAEESLAARISRAPKG